MAAHKTKADVRTRAEWGIGKRIRAKITPTTHLVPRGVRRKGSGTMMDTLLNLKKANSECRLAAKQVTMVKVSL